MNINGIPFVVKIRPPFQQQLVAGLLNANPRANNSDGSSPKKTSPGQARALNVELEPGPSLGPSEKVEPEP